MFKPLAKNKNTNWDDVSRRVYGVPDKASNLQKLNANVQSGEESVLRPETIFITILANMS